MLSCDISEVMMKETDTFRKQARLLEALANEARLTIVDRLAKGECSVGELTGLIGLDPSTVPKHLALLRAHGLVRDRRDGNVVYYELIMPCVFRLFRLRRSGHKGKIGTMIARSEAAPSPAEDQRG
jgi:ArsR family transcriptional regulator